MEKSAFSIQRVVLKGLLLFLLLNLIFVPLNPLPSLARLTAYNHLLPGRLRLPYGEHPDLAYNMSLFSLDAMLASHTVAAQPKPGSEFRVFLIGDSSVWGYLLKPDQTLAAYLNAGGLVAPDGRSMHFYNLGYPTMSLTKDLLILDEAMSYQPDMVIWLFTLESFADSNQLAAPLVQHNPERTRRLIRGYELDLDLADKAFVDPSFLDQTLAGQRRPLADIFRLQMWGILWAATGIDQEYPYDYALPQSDLPADEAFLELVPPTLQAGDLAWEVLKAGSSLAGEIPVWFVNEPIFISQGENSHIRYNFFYPRWAYDQYRQQLAQVCQENGWRCLDYWDGVPAGQFTNTAIHLSPVGSAWLAQQLALALEQR